MFHRHKLFYTTSLTNPDIQKRVEQTYLSLCPCTGHPSASAVKLHLDARVQSSMEESSSPTRAPDAGSLSCIFPFRVRVYKKIRRSLIWSALFSILIMRCPDILLQYTFHNKQHKSLGLFRCCMPPQTFSAADAHNT